MRKQVDNRLHKYTVGYVFSFGHPLVLLLLTVFRVFL